MASQGQTCGGTEVRQTCTRSGRTHSLWDKSSAKWSNTQALIFGRQLPSTAEIKAPTERPSWLQFFVAAQYFPNHHVTGGVSYRLLVSAHVSFAPRLNSVTCYPAPVSCLTSLGIFTYKVLVRSLPYSIQDRILSSLFCGWHEPVVEIVRNCQKRPLRLHHWTFWGAG
jgi:hypothetical protein